MPQFRWPEASIKRAHYRQGNGRANHLRGNAVAGEKERSDSHKRASIARKRPAVNQHRELPGENPAHGQKGQTPNLGKGSQRNEREAPNQREKQRAVLAELAETDQNHTRCR